MTRKNMLRGGLLASLALAGLGSAFWLQAAAPTDDSGELTGGNTTVYATGKNAFSFPFANLDDDERTRFAIGNSFFKRNWVEAPASTTARDGLGPHFIARSCAGCHVLDGRGAPPDYRRTLGPEPEPTVALLMRLSVPGAPEAHAGVFRNPPTATSSTTPPSKACGPKGGWRSARAPSVAALQTVRPTPCNSRCTD